MKKILISTAILLFTLNVSFANPVTPQAAKQVAMNFFAPSGKKSSKVELENVYTRRVHNQALYYVFQRTGGGFVIVSGQEHANPIMGYSHTGKVGKTLNPNVLYYLDWQAQVRANQQNANNNGQNTLVDGAKGNPQLDTLKTVGPIMKTTWNQEPYYNNLCPKKALTGCVATAMAQVMKHHNWPKQGRSWHRYQHKDYGKLDAYFDSTHYDWNNMPTKLDANSSKAQINAVATLMYHCGVSVDMNYGKDGSGAFSRDVLHALVTYFGYRPDSIHQYFYLGVDSATHGGITECLGDTIDTDWYKVIEENIDNNRPLIFGGFSSKPGGGGHAWVCDGYSWAEITDTVAHTTDTLKLVHMNWGWGGSQDGWYSMEKRADDDLADQDLARGPSIIGGIIPDSSATSTTKNNMLWTVQASGFKIPYSRFQSICAVNNYVVWGGGVGDRDESKDKAPEFTRTIDGGEHWIAGPIGGKSKFKNYGVSMISAVSADTAWAAIYAPSGSGTIVQTVDGGTTWQDQGSEMFQGVDGFPNVVHFWNSNKGFCEGDPNVGSNGDSKDKYWELYTTDDGGNTWNRVEKNNIPQNLPTETNIVGYYAASDSLIYIPTTMGRLYKSNNYGHNWTVVETPFYTDQELHKVMKEKFQLFNVCLKTPTTGFIWMAGDTLKDQDPYTYVYYYRFFRSTDGFKTFEEFTPDLNDIHFADFCYDATGDTLISCGFGGKPGISYSTDDGLSFTEYAPFYKNYVFDGLAVSPQGAAWATSVTWSENFEGVWHRGPLGLSADFSVSKSSVRMNDSTITFTDLSSGAPETYFWNFGEGASPDTLSGPGPHKVKYTTDGEKTVTLTITRGDLIHCMVKRQVLKVNRPAAVETDALKSTQVVYPNPAGTTQYVSIKDFRRGTIQVFNSSGAQVWSSQGSTSNARIDISTLNAGMYLVKINNDDGTVVTRKLMISK